MLLLFVYATLGYNESRRDEESDKSRDATQQQQQQQQQQRPVARSARIGPRIPSRHLRMWRPNNEVANFPYNFIFSTRRVPSKSTPRTRYAAAPPGAGSQYSAGCLNFRLNVSFSAGCLNFRLDGRLIFRPAFSIFGCHPKSAFFVCDSQVPQISIVCTLVVPSFHFTPHRLYCTPNQQLWASLHSLRHLQIATKPCEDEGFICEYL
ncbi:hypothetical protein V9T40_007463 [Parthenolecanium corni]|uniref:Uncharacterized protein n=1 Tax=Parthenolecanium corni TaxID=536013 RepID=A0AAN9TLQ1_9HEMI